ncbi:MAG TPA: hypothetical protein VLM16_02440, partial [Ginsengibacter sp.]|nr:hypothetical protein [Ginsengibacter sp.]
ISVLNSPTATNCCSNHAFPLGLKIMNIKKAINKIFRVLFIKRFFESVKPIIILRIGQHKLIVAANEF